MEKSEAIAVFGSAKKLADKLGITRQAVHAWGDKVPDLYRYKLHYLSEGKLPLDKEQEKPQ